MMKNILYKKIAIVKLSAMGDIIHSMVALQYIKNRYPNIIIDWFVEKNFSEILTNNPNIDNIYELNLKSIKKDKFKIFEQIKLIKSYSKNNYDLVIDAQGLLKSAIVSKLLGKNVAGFDKYSIREKIASFFYDIKVDIPYHENAIDRNCKVLSYPLGFNITRKNIIDKEKFLFYKKNDLDFSRFFDRNKKNILFVIGASKENKIYPKEKFIELINKLEENCLVLWSSKEEKTAAEIIVKNTNTKMLPKIDLNILKLIISNMDLIIGNDTGPSHIAWALNIPSITIYGCTPGKRNSYITKKNKIIESSSYVNPNKLNKNDFSINEIEVDDIVKIAKDLM